MNSQAPRTSGEVRLKIESVAVLLTNYWAYQREDEHPVLNTLREDLFQYLSLGRSKEGGLSEEGPSSFFPDHECGCGLGSIAWLQPQAGAPKRQPGFAAIGPSRYGCFEFLDLFGEVFQQLLDPSPFALPNRDFKTTVFEILNIILDPFLVLLIPISGGASKGHRRA